MKVALDDDLRKTTVVEQLSSYNQSPSIFSRT